MVVDDEFREAFSKAEEDIKYAELAIYSFSTNEDDDCLKNTNESPRGVVVPSLNELRYAAKHLLNAMQLDSSSPEYQEQIRRATRHCIRARLDALKATVLFLVRDFRAFSQDYRLVPLPQNERDQMNAHRETIQAALKILSKDHSQSTNEECGKLKECVERLHGFYLVVERDRDKYNQILAEIDNHNKSSTMQWMVGLAIAVISFLLGLCF